MLHYDQVFANVSKRRGSKCCGVLMKRCHKVKTEKGITLQIAQQLKTKNILLPGQLFCRWCKAKFFFGDRLTVLMIKIKFNLLQILTMNSLIVKQHGKAPINWNLTCQLTLIYGNFKEQHFRSTQGTS